MVLGVWRAIMAVLAFPVIYLAVGSVIGPIMVDRYRTGVAGLILQGYGRHSHGPGPTQRTLPAGFRAGDPALDRFPPRPDSLVWMDSHGHGRTIRVTRCLVASGGAPFDPRPGNRGRDSFSYTFVIAMLLKPRAGKADRIAQAALSG
jgi:hypothetical protein